MISCSKYTVERDGLFIWDKFPFQTYLNSYLTGSYLLVHTVRGRDVCMFMLVHTGLGFLIGIQGFPGGPAGKESTCNAGDLGSVPGSGRYPGEGIGYLLQYPWASLVA